MYEITLTKIANIALGHIGSPRIKDINEETALAKDLKGCITAAVNQALRHSQWRFNVKTVRLSYVGDEDPFDYGFNADYEKYAVWPAELSRVIGMRTAENADIADVMVDNSGNAWFPSSSPYIKVSGTYDIDVLNESWTDKIRIDRQNFTELAGAYLASLAAGPILRRPLAGTEILQRILPGILGNTHSMKSTASPTLDTRYRRSYR